MVGLTERARALSVKTDEACAHPLLPAQAKLVLRDAAALLEAMAREVERLKPFVDED